MEQDKKNQRIGWCKKLSFYLILIFLSLIPVLIVAELALPHFFKMEKVTIVYDPLLGYRGRPNISTIWTGEIQDHPRIVRTNRYGFHDTDHDIGKKPGVYRIAFIGDSFLEAYHVEIKDNFCRRVESLLNAEKSKGRERFETINLGVHGYGLGVYDLYVRKRLEQWNPDAVVIALYAGNDFYDNYYSMASAAVPRFRLADGKLELIPMQTYTFKYWLRDNVLASSNLMRFLWLGLIRKNVKLMDVARGAGMVVTPSYDFGDREKLRQTAALAEIQLNEIDEILRERNVKLFIFMIPHPRRVRYLAQQIHVEPGTDEQTPIKDMEFMEPEITAFMSKQGIAYIFPLMTFTRAMASGNDVYLQHGRGHFTVYGHEISAQLIEKPLFKLIAQNKN